MSIPHIKDFRIYRLILIVGIDTHPWQTSSLIPMTEMHGNTIITLFPLLNTVKILTVQSVENF